MVKNKKKPDGYKQFKKYVKKTVKVVKPYITAAKPYVKAVGTYAEETSKNIAQEFKPEQKFNPKAVTQVLPGYGTENLRQAEMELRSLMTYGYINSTTLNALAGKHNVPFSEMEKLAFMIRKQMGGRQPTQRRDTYSGFGFGGF